MEWLGLSRGWTCLPCCCFQADFGRTGAHRCPGAWGRTAACAGTAFPTFSLQHALYGKMSQKKGKNPGRWRGAACCSRQEEEWWLRSWLWEGAAAQGSEGTEQLLSSATSVTPERSFQLCSCTHFPQSLRPQSQASCLEALVGRSSQSVMV